MRVNEILTEANADYAAMFRFLSTFERNIAMSIRLKLVDLEVGLRASTMVDRMIQRAKMEVGWARSHLKRHDRVIWWLRFVRVCILKKMKVAFEAIAKSGAPQIMAQYNRFLDAYVDRSAIPVSLTDVTDFYNAGVQRSLEHLYSLPIRQIQDFHPVDENPLKLVKHLKSFEKTWQASRKQLIPQGGSDGRILLRFPSGLVWMQLDRAACEHEGSAMGHCGNATRQGSDETILSLREPVQKGNDRFWKPHLTFILDADGYLGEMKGRFNLKPSLAHRRGHAPSDFHNEIEVLLRLPIIRGIKGGGYKPEQNFSVDDLGTARRDKLFREVPHLANAVSDKRHDAGEDEDEDNEN